MFFAFNTSHTAHRVTEDIAWQPLYDVEYDYPTSEVALAQSLLPNCPYTGVGGVGTEVWVVGR